MINNTHSSICINGWALQTILWLKRSYVEVIDEFYIFFRRSTVSMNTLAYIKIIKLTNLSSLKIDFRRWNWCWSTDRLGLTFALLYCLAKSNAIVKRCFSMVFRIPYSEMTRIGTPFRPPVNSITRWYRR